LVGGATPPPFTHELRWDGAEFSEGACANGLDSYSRPDRLSDRPIEDWRSIPDPALSVVRAKH
jgi:hypothetical protein